MKSLEYVLELYAENRLEINWELAQLAYAENFIDTEDDLAVVFS